MQDGSTRFAVLEVIKKLDRESIAYHTVTVVAFDGGTPTPRTGNITVNVSVSDSNDNMPLFDQPLYNASISEGAIPGTDVTQVKATDLDAGVNGDITYRYTTSNEFLRKGTVYGMYFYSIDRTKSDPDQLFRINSVSGTIYINKMLDSEAETEHSLTVLATDGGAQVYAIRFSVRLLSYNSIRVISSLYRVMICTLRHSCVHNTSESSDIRELT